MKPLKVLPEHVWLFTRNVRAVIKAKTTVRVGESRKHGSAIIYHIKSRHMLHKITTPTYTHIHTNTHAGK